MNKKKMNFLQTNKFKIIIIVWKVLACMFSVIFNLFSLNIPNIPVYSFTFFKGTLSLL